MLKKQRQNSHIVEKIFSFCECCTISDIWQKVQDMRYNIDRPPVTQAFITTDIYCHLFDKAKAKTCTAIAAALDFTKKNDTLPQDTSTAV